MPQSQSQSQKAQDKDKDKDKEKKKSSSKKQKNDELDDSIDIRKGDTPRETPKKGSLLSSTQDTIAQFFERESKERTESRSDDRVSSELVTIIKSMEQKMSNMITTDHLHSEFKKLITVEVLASNLEKLKADLNKNFKEELDKVYERVKEIERKSQKADKTVIALKNQVSDKESDIENLTAENENLKKRIEKLEECLAEAKFATKVNERHVNDLAQYSRRNNVRIYGINDRKKNETAAETTSLVISFLKDKLNVDAQARDIDIAHRLGQFREDGNRVIICRFMSRTLRNDVMTNRKMLKGSAFVIREDLTFKNAKLLEEASAVSNVKAAWSDQGKVLVLLDSDKKMQVTLDSDLKNPLVPKSKKGE